MLSVCRAAPMHHDRLRARDILEHDRHHLTMADRLLAEAVTRSQKADQRPGAPDHR